MVALKAWLTDDYEIEIYMNNLIAEWGDVDATPQRMREVAGAQFIIDLTVQIREVYEYARTYDDKYACLVYDVLVAKEEVMTATAKIETLTGSRTLADDIIRLSSGESGRDIIRF